MPFIEAVDDKLAAFLYFSQEEMKMNQGKKNSYLLIIIFVFLGSFSNVSPTAFAKNNSQDYPEAFVEKVTFTGTKPIVNSPDDIQRTSIYEIHDDDAVTPNHAYSGLPYYETFTFTGPDDAEWLVLEGNFSHYEINNNQVTFYNLQDWLHFIYRTNLFVYRSPDQIYFGVTSGLGSPTDVDASVTFPGYYGVLGVTPTGYSIPSAGIIQWNFIGIMEYTLSIDFSGLGPDRPLLDFPVDYSGRSSGSITGFTAAFNTRITSKFDHYYPYLVYQNWDCINNPLSGIQHDDMITDWTGEPKGPPGNICNCELGVSSYDGHNGYDIDDRCPPQAPCSDPTAVYAAAEGDIIPSDTGWNSVLGCRVTIDHGGGWNTVYAHLQDISNNHECENISSSGPVTNISRIGTIGGTGSGGGGPYNTHLHFVVLHNGIVVDPSGWEPNPLVSPDPWAQHPNGTASYPMWLYSVRTTMALDPSYGGQLTSPTHQILVDVPQNFYSDSLMFNLGSQPISQPSASLLNTSHSFSLTATDTTGNSVHQLDENLILHIDFSMTDVQGIKADSLSIYTWDENTDSWNIILTTIDWVSMTATALTSHLSLFALLGESENIIYLPIIVH
jgi:hypothetical protein